MEVNFSKKFTFPEFLKFIAPAIISMMFLSFYTIIDGIFVATLVGSDALASINIILPIINIIFGIAIMMGTGGSAIVAIKLGENKEKEANQAFTLVSIASLIMGGILATLGVIFIKEIALALGATDTILPYSISFGRIIILFTPIFIIKTVLEFFIRTDGNFNFSLMLSIVSGVINIIFDYILIKVLNMGIAGAAWATGLGVLVSTILALYYFLSSKSKLKFKTPKLNFKLNFRLLIDAMVNGFGEMVTELSTGITTVLFNMLALKYAGENGLASLTIILYADFLMVSVYLGLVAGISPIISYNYGSENHSKLKEIYRYSKAFILTSSLLIFAVSIIFAPTIVGIFVPPNSAVFNIALNGLKIFSIAFLFVGVNIFASGLFTALSNGKPAAILALCRSFVFILLGAITLPKLFELNGVWLTVPLAEALTILISAIFIKKYRKLYKY